MTIARSQMNRQLYGIGNLVEREQYGLGSVLKKFAKTFIPKELDPVLQVAAPFLGPVYGPIAAVAGSARTGKINPLTLAAATLPYVQFGGEGATGLGSFMPVGYGGSGAIELPGGALQVGQKGTSLASALGKYFDIGATPYSEQGQGTVSKIFSTLNPASTLTGPERIANILDLGRSATDAIFYKIDPKTGQQVLDKQAAFAFVMSIPSYIDAKKKADELGIPASEFNEQIYNEQKGMFQTAYQSNAPASSFGIRMEEKAEGGIMNGLQQPSRVGYGLGDLVRSSGIATPVSGASTIDMSGGFGGMISRLIQQNPQMFKTTQTTTRSDFIDLNGNGIDDREERPVLAEGGILSIKLTPMQAKALGGRIGYGTGSGDKKDDKKPIPLIPEDYEYSFDDEKSFQDFLKQIGKRRMEEKAEGGPMGSEIPTRQNQGGVTELDLRAKGGYIPVGIKEKADDVPAMLSKNEFVFTADAVRGAGNGSINKGAQKMYKLMKSLEKKVKKVKVA